MYVCVYTACIGDHLLCSSGHRARGITCYPEFVRVCVSGCDYILMIRVGFFFIDSRPV